ncbi:MAP kinase kinase PBS2 [Penicillium angulare]|uniref:MAP kinase kinase PBS2 n=1 Tax=Penicillium angulare TaxID=116970 RepID=UPI0025421998|nr:MAP kinase kinase PBS2 [Penicillium angulare]KAJ5288190.1 MAP kinase kinase PBS2 [Penicillium angulare]
MTADRDFATENPPTGGDRSPGSTGTTSPVSPISPGITSGANASTPSLLPSRDPTAGMTSTSTHLGQINAARHGAEASPRPLASMSSHTGGGLNQDIMAKMKAFSLSRQGVPLPHAVSTGTIPTSAEVGAGGALAGRAPNQARPSTNHWASSPVVPAVSNPSSPKPPVGGGMKRMKPQLRLSEMSGGAPSPANGTENKPAESTGGESAFSKYAEFIDTKAGTLNFKDKAVLHGGGVEFSSGHSFKISLDEVDRLDELGKGNYGTVYKVRHSRPHLRKPGLGVSGIVSRSNGQAENGDSTGQDNLSGIVMAMKEIRLELDEAKFNQIIMELDILHRCVSPFIIDFYGAFFQEGAVYMCVEYMDGGSIDKIYKGGVPENILRKMTLSTIMGLKSLKDEHNIIHRDVKPTNILVNSKGQVKICDFGVSGNLVASIAKTNIGCQSYMAPERIAGGGMQQSGAPSGGTYSVQSDIWSLGLSIIECAMGRYPYPPEAFTNIFSQLHVSVSFLVRFYTPPFLTFTKAIVHGDPPTLPDTGYSDEAHAFVGACLDKNPSKRPSYNALIRHPWLEPLMRPPSEEESIPQPEIPKPGQKVPSSVTEDKEIADWVCQQLNLLEQGQLTTSEKPALHTVALDKVSPSPGNDVDPEAEAEAPSLEG